MSKSRATRDIINTGSINAGGNVVFNTIGGHSRSGSTGRNSGGRRDEFRPSFYAPPNPCEILLDFGRSHDDTESATPETKVLREILRDDVNEEEMRIVSICGKAGVGKSCILRALGDEKLQEKLKLRERFPGGIYFLSLGMDATEFTLIQGLAEIVQLCGGKELGRELRNEENLHVVVKKVKEWMKGKKCLVLLDDFWERNKLGASNVLKLGQMFDKESGSVIVMTTRFLELATLGVVVEVEEREAMSEKARAMLLRHAKLEREEIEDAEEREALHKVLKMCGGLPLFLSVVGRGVAHLYQGLKSEECGRKAVWRKYWEKLQALGQDELLDTENDEYPDLSTTLRLSLDLLSERRGKRLGKLCASKLSFEEMHRALCVFKKQARIPISVCRRLWKVKSDEAAFSIGQWFAGVGLADIDTRMVGEKHVGFIRVHDLVHMFAVECAEEKEGVGRWHGELLDGYAAKRRGEVVRKWWNICKDAGGDEYLVENVCRHLVSSGNLEEVEGLLVCGEWSKLRHEVGGLSAWKGDFRERLEGGKKNGGSESEKEIEKGLEMVRDAVINSWGVVHENPAELGYQVFGRLIDCENEVVRRYLRSIERVQCKPWLKPLQRCWERPGEGMMIGEFHLGGDVRDIAVHMKSFTAVAGVDREVVILDLQEMRVTARCAGHTEVVLKVEISCDGKRAFSWSRDDTVRQWDAESGEEDKDKRIQLYGGKSAGELGEDDQIECAAFSPENWLVLTGSARGKIQAWDLNSGKRVGRTVDASERVRCIALSPNGRIAAAGLGAGSVLLCDVETGRPLCGELKGHEYEVTGIAFSGDGRLVASCAEDGTVRVWDVASKTQFGDPLRHHDYGYLFPHRVVFSEDSKQIFSTGSARLINVCDVTSGERILSWQAHVYGVRCMAVSGNLGSRLAVSGGYDETVRVWDMQETQNEDNERIYHKGPIWCVAASPDGSFFVSGSKDKTLRMWDGGDGRPLGEALCGHEDAVCSITVNPDSRRVISGSLDGTMRVWDVERSAQVGDALRGHEKGIRCVAYSASGEFVVSGSNDKTVRVWRVIGDCDTGGSDGERASKRVRVVEPGTDESFSGQETLRLKKTFRHDEGVNSVALTQDGQTVLSGLVNGKIVVWDMKSEMCIDRKQSSDGNIVERIEISETNEVVATDELDEDSRWWLDNERALTRIPHSEGGTGTAEAGTREGPMLHEPNEVVCRRRDVQLNSSGQKIATLPDEVYPSAWAYNAQHRVLCAGFYDRRVLFFRVER